MAKIAVSWFAGIKGRYFFTRALKLRENDKLARSHRYMAIAASCGHVDACYELGCNYKTARGCIWSGSEALRWFKSAAASGQRDAQFELGLAHLTDHDTAWCIGSSARWATTFSERKGELIPLIFPEGIEKLKDDLEAFRWLRSSALLGKAEAMANLGWLQYRGIGCERDVGQAKQWFEAAANASISQAALGLAEVYGDKNTNFYDPEQRRSWLLKASELGNPSASYIIAKEISTANASNHEEVEHFLEVACRAHHAAACYDLGLLRFRRSRTQKAAEEAVELIRQAAKKGVAQASCTLGEIYIKGGVIPSDHREAAKWFKVASDAGLSNAHFNLACLYARGDGVVTDLRQAAKYFELSALAGHIIAAYNTAIFYRDGKGFERDLSKAILWFRKAGENNVVPAQVALGKLLSSDLPGMKDQREARLWLERASAAGDVEGQFVLARMMLLSQVGDDNTEILRLLHSAVAAGYYEAAIFILAAKYDHSLLDSLTQVSIECLEKSSEMGVVAAGNALAKELLRGENVKFDESRAIDILEVNAKFGDAAANFELGVFYCRRSHSPSDLGKGLAFYRRAAELGHVLGQYNAGLMLARGVGDTLNLEIGTGLLETAAKQGLKSASDALALLRQPSQGGQ